jgi:hypothetical protein
MPQLHEGLRSNDLEDLVKPIFHIDTYKATTGEDEEVAVLSFEVIGDDASKDLVNFIENGYDFISDASTSDGESNNGTFTVFVEIKRSLKIAKQIEDLIYGIGELAKITDWKFRYHKDFQSKEIEDIKHIVPDSADAYKRKVEKIYYGLVSGTPAHSSGMIDMQIIENPGKPSTYITHDKGKPSQTSY